jgi:hypothetical protein
MLQQKLLVFCIDEIEAHEGVLFILEIKVVIISLYLGDIKLILSDLSHHFWGNMSDFVRLMNKLAKTFLSKMRKILLILSLTTIAIIFCLLKIDFISSIVPGWNTTIPPSYLMYLPVIIFNILIPIYFFFSFYRTILRRTIIIYFSIVNFIFLYVKFSNYFLYYGGSVTIDEMQNHFLIQMFLVIFTLLIHFSFYIFLFLKSKNESKGFS